jgi:subtilase family serine protease
MRRSFHSLLALAVLSICAAASTSSYAVPRNRIASVVDTNRVAVPNTVSGRVKHAADLGTASADRLLTGVTLRFSLTEAQQAALAQLLINLQNPNSPQYHQWLTPEQFAAQFGLSSSDISQVSSWLATQGLTVTEVARSSTFLRVSGTVSQIQKAFGTSIHTVQLNGEQHFANITDPVLPAAIASVVTTITGLDDFKAKPRLKRPTVTPAFTSSQTGNHYIAPGDFNTIYNVTPLLNNSINGSGVGAGVGGGYGIAVMGQVYIPTMSTDVGAFRAAAGLSTTLPTSILGCSSPTSSNGEACNNPGAPTSACLSSAPPSNCFPTADDLSESDLDLEWAGAIAPSANIAFVYSNDIFNFSLTYAIDQNTAPIVTISYGSCEADFGPAGMAAFNQLFEQANAQGQTVINAEGDSGATSCDGDYADYPAVLGLNVGYPGSSPYVTAVGGTMFNEGNATGATTYWNASTSTDVVSSAKSYIPEVPWNESSASGGLAAGSGGASSYFSKPSWQTGTPADSARDVPDISFNSAAVHDPYLYCTMSSCANGTFRESNGVNLTTAGGTSFAAPAFAGVLALIEQKVGSRLGNINPSIYGLAALQNATGSSFVGTQVLFNDVTSGNNSSACVTGTPNCTPSTGGNIGYTAIAGYDLATGWGSLNVSNVANAWITAAPTGINAVAKASSFTSVTTTTTASCGVQGTIALSVAVSNGTTGFFASGVTTAVSSGVIPTGTIQFTVDGVAIGSAQPLSNGSLTNTLNVSALSGVHTIGAIYSGDTIFAGSAGQLGAIASNANGGFLTVTPIDFVSTTAKDFSLGPCTAATSALPGASGTAVALTLTPFNGFTGPITLTAGGISYTAANTGAPVGYSFSVSPVTISSATAATTALTLYAYQNSTNTSTQPVVIGAVHPAFKGMPWYAPVSGGGVLACVLMFTMPRRRRWSALLAVMLSAAAISAIGCGSSSSTAGTGTGGGGGTTVVAAPAGTYVVTVTAASGSTVHSTNVTFTVQ